MLDKNRKVLLKPSPLKMGLLKSVGKWLFGDNSDKDEGKIEAAAASKKLDAMVEEMMDLDTSNPYADAQNAFAGLQNQFADLENVYQGAENVYEGKMKNAFEGQKNAYEGMKNQMEGMENAFEDLTVNTQQAEFEAQQQQQQQANIMSQMAGAAGTSGVAALAQAMANQGALNSQKASASIGQQEAQNAKLAAEAEQKIDFATAEEGSRIAMTQAGEQGRLDTQKNQADMNIQQTILGADQALQTATLNEASKLQTAEAQAETNLQTQAAQGAMTVQELKGTGDMWSKGMEMDKHKTGMEMQGKKLALAGQKANQQEDRGFIGSLVGSDRRMKENIIKIKYSDSGIPIYRFNYKGDNKTWTGTMAQDLIKLGREDAVVTMDNGYYAVKYNLIDVNMKEVKSSPLKQLDQQTNQAGIETARKNVAMVDNGMHILSENQKRKNWEDLQELTKAIMPKTKIIRLLKDDILRDRQREQLSDKGLSELPGMQGIANVDKYMFVLAKRLKVLQGEIFNAIQNEDSEEEQRVKTELASIKRMTDRFLEEQNEFYEDHFQGESYLSKGVSQQRVSIATQIFCDNSELELEFAEDEDVKRGMLDMFKRPIISGQLYAFASDFNGEMDWINVLEANDQMFWVSSEKAMEYLAFLNTIVKGAQQDAKDKNTSSIKPILGRINYKMDMLFGINDDTSTKKQNQLVMQFAWDTHILKDGSSFRRHLYEHPKIQDLNYGGFDWDEMEFNMPLGPGDVDHWTDNIDKLDQLRLVEAICDQDNEFFDINLLRTLVKEYYAYKIENAWWKAMGFSEGKLAVMRLKQNELIKQRFEKDKASAASVGAESFTFDGEVHKTGIDIKKFKKEEKEISEKVQKMAEQNLNQQQTPGATPGAGQTTNTTQ